MLTIILILNTKFLTLQISDLRSSINYEILVCLGFLLPQSKTKLHGYFIDNKFVYSRLLFSQNIIFPFIVL